MKAVATPHPNDAREPVARPSPRRVLSRERVVEGALAVADREGLDALSMRRLAADLGVGTMTLYSYFASKDELLEAMVARVAADVVIPAPRGPWRRRLRTLILEIHRSLVEHPCGVELRQRRPILGEAALRVTEAGLGILTDAGFSAPEAVRAWRTLFVYTFGYASFNPSAVPDSVRDAWRARVDDLPPEEFPILRAAGDAVVETMSGARQFEHGLERLLAGLAESLES